MNLHIRLTPTVGSHGYFCGFALPRDQPLTKLDWPQFPLFERGALGLHGEGASAPKLPAPQELGERGPLEDMLQPWGLVDFDRRRCTITSDPHLADGAQMAKTSHGQSGLI